jgi:selenocysteine-specific elongation factor
MNATPRMPPNSSNQGAELAPMATDLILGTAGHIDHGKTSLIKALTGTDTDRLPEEKKRGITIELGFAELDLGSFRLGIVDVPGHERFVRNMLAGATGIDLALLVVAADESVKQQTREHFEILKLLDIPTGVVALTKCEVPDADWIELVEEEVRELVADSFLAEAAIVRVSAHRGQGLAKLRQALAASAQQAAQARAARLTGGPFRMAIDRVFTIAGHGTVVTGSVSSGTAALGDELVIEPGGVAVRVRGLQNHDRPVERIHVGQRAALNLAGIHHEQVLRGQEVATPGHLIPAKLLTVRLQLLPSAPRPLKNRAQVRLHVGTAELMASVVLLDVAELAPSESCLAQLFLSESAVTTWRQPFVIRQQSPMLTIGGGIVLDPTANKLKRGESESVDMLRQLESADPPERAAAAISLAGLKPWEPVDLARSAGIADGEQVVSVLVERGEVVALELPSNRSLRVSRRWLEGMFQRIEQALGRLHDEFPLHAMLDRSRLLARLDYLGNDPLVEAMIAALAKTGRVRRTDRGIALAGRGPQLTNNEQKLVSELIAIYQAAGLQPPTVEEVRSKITRNQAVVGQLIALAANEGHLVAISAEFYLHHEVERQLRETLSGPLTESGGLTVSQIREILGISRKYAVPICEYLDRAGFTRRQGDIRVLGSMTGANT